MNSNKQKVAFLGPFGTYTHQATLQQFGEDADLLAQKSINDCFAKLHEDEVEYAVVPFENSTNGQVMFTYDLLRDWLIPANGKVSFKFKIVAEQFVGIHHCVLSHATDISKVEKIYTHPQVWGQCTNWLNTIGKDLDKIDSSSTSKAAQIVTREGEKVAAIASEHAAKIYNIPILYKNIENVKDNTTRFLILSKRETEVVNKSQYVTLLAFTIKHQDTGALVRTLNILETHNINMTSITSRPSGIKAWQYVFFIEFCGDGAHDSRVQSVINEFEEKSLNSVVVGTFPRNKRYFGDEE